ncbi:hypothetical protein [Borreliella garinii]|nr:hypothetical protein PT142_04740 [Borreliella garinii]
MKIPKFCIPNNRSLPDNYFLIKNRHDIDNSNLNFQGEKISKIEFIHLP